MRFIQSVSLWFLFIFFFRLHCPCFAIYPVHSTHCMCTHTFSMEQENERQRERGIERGREEKKRIIISLALRHQIALFLLWFSSVVLFLTSLLFILVLCCLVPFWFLCILWSTVFFMHCVSLLHLCSIYFTLLSIHTLQLHKWLIVDL